VPKVAADASKLHVNDTSKVVRDDLLPELDPREFEVAVDITNADLKGAEPNVANIEAEIREEQAIIAESRPLTATRPWSVSRNSSWTATRRLRAPVPEPSNGGSRRNQISGRAA
jgi:multidrug resistance efflux pump